MSLGDLQVTGSYLFKAMNADIAPFESTIRLG